MSTEEEGLKIKIEDGIATLTLDRPSARNAIDEDSAAEYAQFFRDATTNTAVRSILLTSTGRDFSVGGGGGKTPKPLPTHPMDYRFVSLPHIEMFRAMWETEKPVVSAVNGTVAGVGWLLALMADLVVAAKGTRWTHVFVKRVMVPHAGDSFFLPRIIPFHRLNEIALLGDMVPVEKLDNWGLINRLVDPADLMPTAMELARKLADQPTRAMGLAKRNYRRSLQQDWATIAQEEMNAQAFIAQTEDKAEFGKALAEGRPPVFTGN